MAPSCNLGRRRSTAAILEARSGCLQNLACPTRSSMGARSLRLTRAGAQGHFGHDPESRAEASSGSEESEGLDGLLGDVAVEFVDEAVEQILETSILVDPTIGPAPCGAGDGALDAEGAKTADVAAPEVLGGLGPVEEVRYTIDEYVAASMISVVGYVACDLEPCKSVGLIARIPAWPYEAPPERQSASCICYTHKKCSVARSRTAVSDQQFLRWCTPQ